MFELNDNFLEELGLGALTAEQKEAVLQIFYEKVEERVGEKLTDTMSDAQVDEFARFLEDDKSFSDEWLSENDPEYAQDELFKRMKQLLPEASEIDIMAEYASMKWLQVNRPDYPQVVEEAINEVAEIFSAIKDKILDFVSSS